MTRFISRSALIALTVSITACGGSGGGGGSATDMSGNYLDGACGSSVISDYNNVVLKCKYMRTDNDARDCKSTAQSFQAKYSNINCSATTPSNTSVNDTPITITPSTLQPTIDKLTGLGF